MVYFFDLKIVLSMISYLSDETGSCFVSNKYIASIVNVTSDRVSKIVSSLKKKGYIEVKLKFKTDSKEVESRQIISNKEKLNRYNEKYLEGIGENNYLDSQKQLYPIGENNKDIIYRYFFGKGVWGKINFSLPQQILLANSVKKYCSCVTTQVRK